MNLTRYCLNNPVGVLIVVVIACLLGLFSLTSLPIQLFPDIQRPWMSVNSGWRAAAPQEVESEIIEPLEEVLKGIPGLQQMRSSARSGNGNISLQFGLDTDMQKTSIDLISRLNRLSPLPADATLPAFSTGSDNESLAWFFIQLLPGSGGQMSDHIDYVKNFIVPQIESVSGVANVGYGWTEIGQREVQITFDPYRAAQFGISITDITALLGRSNDVSGGRAEVGRREYTLRFRGRLSPDQLSGLILEWRNGQPVKLGDIADIDSALSNQRQSVFQNGNPAIGIQVSRESSANVLTTLTAVKEKVTQLRDGPLKEKGLSIAISFDSTVFIKRAIGLLANNLVIGLLLASFVLWCFLRHSRATLLITLTVPISLFAAFIVLQLTGRTLNVISLAGLAFAVGMVMDAAIVVLENIVRLREGGENAKDAGIKGASQVWNALLASTATTVAIFIPVLFMVDTAGQLFADLALTIAVGVSISLVVAVTVLPTISHYWMKDISLKSNADSRLFRITDTIMTVTNTAKRRYVWIAGLIISAITATVLLMPKLDYLPPVKRDAVDAFFSKPPGSAPSYVRKEVLDVMVKRLQPYMEHKKQPYLKNYYIIDWGGGGTIGARALDQSRVGELEILINSHVLANLPDVNGFARQGNLFGGFGSDGSVQINLQSADQLGLINAAQKAIGILKQVMPEANVNPPVVSGMTTPELQFFPKEERIVELGWTRADLGQIVRVMGEGLWLGEHFDGDQRLDVILRVNRWNTPEQLASLPIATPSGSVVPLSEMLDIKRQVGPSRIDRVDGRRTITLNVQPAPGISLQEILETIQTKVEPQILALMPSDGSIRYGGSADDLKNAIVSMSSNFAIALCLLLVLMAGLFKSLRDALLVVISIPLAVVGGIISLRLLNLVTFQPLDLLTMIGFIILLGLVVNNAILLVHQTREAERKNGLSRRDAVFDALRVRIRPILMSTLTSLFGMLPLLLFPGEGSAIYRGLAAAIVGGMSVSTLFTLILLPSLLRLGEEKTASKNRENCYPDSQTVIPIRSML